MKVGSRKYDLAVLACVALLAPTLAKGAECQDQPNWSPDRLAKFDAAVTNLAQGSPAKQAIDRLQDRLARFDAAVVSLEQDFAARQAAIRIKAEAVLKELRDRRDVYRAKVKEVAASAMTWKDAQLANARESLDEAAKAFHAKVDTYLDAVDADIGVRQAVMQVQFRAWEFN